MPDVTQYVEKYGQSWWEWYIHLQPEWRIQKEGDSIQLVGEPPEDYDSSDWADIKKGGPNGIFSLILSLGWWGSGASDQSAAQIQDWNTAFNDLAWVLEFLITEADEDQDESNVVPGKRGADSDISPTPAKK